MKRCQYSQYVHVPQVQRGFTLWSKCFLIPKHTWQKKTAYRRKHILVTCQKERCYFSRESWRHSSSGFISSSSLQPQIRTCTNADTAKEPPLLWAVSHIAVWHCFHGCHWVGCPSVLDVAVGITGGIPSHTWSPREGLTHTLQNPTGPRAHLSSVPSPLLGVWVIHVLHQTLPALGTCPALCWGGDVLVISAHRFAVG